MKTIYEPLFKRKNGFDKMRGGSVWPSRIEVNRYLKRTRQGDLFSVYGVQANWHLDTKSTSGCKFRDLRINAKCIKL